MKEKTDIVLIWVDDNDPVWRDSYREHSLRERGESGEVRFRDWGTLRYWFRGIEKFAPWADRVFLITCGHYPEWLNLDNPRLRFVKHSDYIPAEYLPTFNSNTIELNLHRIEDLSEQFVYFNDDTYLIDHVPETRFFKFGLPCDMAALTAIQPEDESMRRVIYNDVAFINRNFKKGECFEKNKGKWLNTIYGKYFFRTLVLKSYPHFTGFIDPHLPNAFLKKNIAEAWKLGEDEFHRTCICKFRQETNLNQYAVRYLQLVRGEFNPINPFRTSIVYRSLEDKDIENAVRDIRNQKRPVLCLNDGPLTDFEEARKKISDAFESILPDKCSFEK